MSTSVLAFVPETDVTTAFEALTPFYVDNEWLYVLEPTVDCIEAT